MGLTIRYDLYISENSFKYVDNCQEDFKMVVVSELKKRKGGKCPANTNAKRVIYKTNSPQEDIGEKAGTDKLKSSKTFCSKLDKIDSKKYSNTIKDAVKTTCKVCNPNITLSKMGIHTSRGCRFQDSCAYKHSQKLLATNQSDVNIAVAQVTVKHEEEIKTLKDEINYMKIAMKAMEDIIKFLTNELKEHCRADEEVVIENVVSEETKDHHNINEDTES